jgi:NADH-quinone oxidoreductase subunit L
MIAGALAISGIPPFSGFFSKDAILAQAWHMHPVWWIAVLTVSLLTAFYMFRLIVLVFFGVYRGGSASEAVHESPAVMTVPLVILGVLSLAGGLINIPALFGGNHWLSSYTGMAGFLSENSLVTEWILITFAFLAISVVIYLSYAVFGKRAYIPVPDSMSKGITRVLVKKYYVDEVYTFLITKPLSWISERLYSFVDIRVVDAMVERIGNSVIWLSRTLRYVQSGSISFYLLFMVVGIILVLIFNLFL